MIELRLNKESKQALVDISDALTDYPQTAKKAITTALKIEGFRLRSVMKWAIAMGGVPGHRWPGINMAARRMTQANRSGGRVKNWRSAWRGKKGRKRRGREYWSVNPPPTPRHAAVNPFAKFKGGLRYNVDESHISMEVGFVNPSTPFQRILERHATGFSTPISPAARRFAFAMGLPIAKHKHFFHIPSRPLVGPVWDQEKSQSLRNIESKFIRIMDESL